MKNMAPIKTQKKVATTAQIAKYLESDEVYHQTEYIVLVWAKLNLPRFRLAQQLEQLVVAANERRNGNALDLSEVEWSKLASRYVKMFR